MPEPKRIEVSEEKSKGKSKPPKDEGELEDLIGKATSIATEYSGGVSSAITDGYRAAVDKYRTGEGKFDPKKITDKDLDEIADQVFLYLTQERITKMLGYKGLSLGNIGEIESFVRTHFGLTRSSIKRLVRSRGGDYQKLSAAANEVEAKVIESLIDNSLDPITQEHVGGNRDMYFTVLNKYTPPTHTLQKGVMTDDSVKATIKGVARNRQSSLPPDAADQIEHYEGPVGKKKKEGYN